VSKCVKSVSMPFTTVKQTETGSKWLSCFVSAHQHKIGHSVPKMVKSS